VQEKEARTTPAGNDADVLPSSKSADGTQRATVMRDHDRFA
jgi:hypothetical protein